MIRKNTNKLNRKGTKSKYRASFKFKGKLFILIRVNDNKKQLRRIKKFKQKYYAETTWFDLVNNGEIKWYKY